MAIEQHTGYFTGAGGVRLFYQSWGPPVKPRAILLLVHGLAEHSGRYLNLVNELVPAGFLVCALDHRGYGRSEGRRCYVKRFDDYVEDLNTYINIVREAYPDIKIFMVGHSLGGTIATAFAEAHQEKLAGLILSAPALKAGSSITRRDKLLARIASRLAPTAGVSSLDATSISKDPAVVKAYVSDPLVYTGKISARLGAEILKAIEKTIPPLMQTIKLPILIMQGAEDRLSNPEGSKLIFEGVSSSDKTLKRYDGLFHEIFNEPERAIVFADMRQWLAARV
ncbi:MAG: lysophospholipase [Dehalococcoidales bacterium]